MVAPRACLALLALYPCALPSVATAGPPRTLAAADDDPRARARTLTREGLRAFEDGRYATAIDAFEEAYALAPLPALLLNIAQAHRLDGDCRAALAHYLKYLRLEPASQHQGEVATRIDEMQACIDRGAPPATPTPTPVPPAGAVRPVEPGPGATPRRLPPQSPRRTLAWSFVAGGVAGVGVGLFFGFRAADAADTVDAYLDRGGPWTEEYQDLEARGKRDQTIALVTGGLGAAALATAGFLFYFGDPEPPPIAPVVTPESAGVSWTTRW